VCVVVRLRGWLWWWWYLCVCVCVCGGGGGVLTQVNRLLINLHVRVPQHTEHGLLLDNEVGERLMDEEVQLWAGEGKSEKEGGSSAYARVWMCV
jgi:hypothetical protein